MGVEDGITWAGEIGEVEKLTKYANCLAVVFPPVDEDYGYITLEAMLSAKPVITCTDSGGTNEFVISGQTGHIVEPDPAALGQVFDELWSDRSAARQMGRAARDHYNSMDISWSSVLRRLLSEA